MDTQLVASSSSAMAWQPLVRMALWPIILSCAGSTLASYFPSDALLFGLVMVAAVLGSLLVGVIKAVIDFFRRRRAVAGRRLFLIAMAIPLAWAGLYSGDYLHFALSYPYYLLRIAQTSERPVRFYWGDAAVTVFDAPLMRTLVYDDSGVARAAVGKNRQERDGYSISTTHLIGNFYMELACE